jgi:eukaryotic-like serine/threonine-protein kinase
VNDGESSVVKKTPDDSASPTDQRPTAPPDDPKEYEAATVVHRSETTEHVSDVVLAESESSKDVSDVVLAESATIRAPSFRAPSPAGSVPPQAGPTIELRRDENRASRDKTPMALLPGAKVDDFEIVRLLGRGAFGHVYLARQVSLDRLVALKVSANRGSEGRTMARLEHQHIVQVFSETVDPDFNQRLLCMQLVPGIGLDKLIGLLHDKARSHPEGTRQGAGSLSPASAWTGKELIGFIDSSGSLPAALDPAALHDREALNDMDAVEATAWFGARLAEALDFAHHNGVLHRDIKPANILVNPYGRPMLADFNISSQPVGSEASGEEMFGGTFAYMAPEHLDAFNPGDTTGHEAVTAKSDLYSLGLVLQQLLNGRISFPLFTKKGSLVETLKKMASDRRTSSPVCCKGLPGARMTLERSISRCLEADPEDRYASGAELAEQLDGCRRLRESERQLPPVPAIFGRILRRPFVWLVALVVLPQVAASAVNIAYNLTQIVAEMDEAQKAQFYRTVNIYNAIVYPVAILAFVLTVRPIARVWKMLSNAERLTEGEVKEARRRALRIPRFIAGLTAFGWFPGAFIFPFVIWSTTGLRLSLACHFVASFVLSGMIALAYSLGGVEFVVLRGLYPGLWRDAQHFTAVAREELAPVNRHLSWISRLAVAIPLVAATLVVMLGSSPNLTFRLLVAALIFLGLFGLRVTSAITRHLSGVVVALTKPKG